ncbi:hypothetical protein [Ammoniphilus sp. CFH 90114]|uniref:hypothetical protein n=1 Tax=Ammoniphilus sp. CFH 90114 TaxID=2493665 RepID=UPI0013E98548|nr:hypothetical protein [Ammoniphilus sp. CFH 90114]
MFKINDGQMDGFISNRNNQIPSSGQSHPEKLYHRLCTILDFIHEIHGLSLF